MEQRSDSWKLSWHWWIIALLLAPLLWWGLQPRLMQRVLIAEVQADPGTHNSAIRWSAKNGRESGAWLMPAPRPDESQGSSPTRLTESLRLSIPSYPIQDLRLTWEGPAPARVWLEDARVEHRLVKFVLETHRITPTSPQGSAPPTQGPHTEAYTPPPHFGPKVFAIGSLSLALGLFAALALLALAPLLARSVLLAHVLVWSTILLVNGYYALRVPCLVTSDGIDYLDAADWLARHTSVTHFVPYKSPGLGFILALVMAACENVLLCFTRLQVAMGLATALLAYRLVRPRFSPHWGLLAALLVGVHPVLITYRLYLLRETTAALVCISVIVLLSRFATPHAAPPSSRVRAPLCLALALVGAAGAYMRENLQLFALYLPLVLLTLAGPWWRVRLPRAALTLASILALLLPWCWRNHADFGAFAMVTPKTHLNRVLSGWTNEVIDPNDTSAFSRERWRSLADQVDRGKVNHYDFLSQLIAAEQERLAARGESTILAAKAIDDLARRTIDESIARHGPRSLLASLQAGVNQFGLWNLDGVEGAPENEWWSRPLRKQPFDFDTTICFDIDASLAGVRAPEEHQRLREMLTRERVPIASISTVPVARQFNEWYWASRAIRPAFAVLGLLGIVLAWRRGDRVLALGGAMAVLNVILAASVVATPSDRFSVAFLPVTLCVAVSAVAMLTSHRRPAPCTTATASNPSS
jgi:hypothetical protein